MTSQTPHPARRHARRKGVCLPLEPCLPAPTRDPLHHPDKTDHVRNRKRLGSCDGRPPKFDEIDYCERHVVECGTNRLKRHRTVAIRYEKLAVRDEATVLIAAINEWL